MTTALFDVCDLNNPLVQPNCLVIQQHNDIDGNFLISSFLQQRLKARAKNASVILVCTEQTYNHYQNSCLKLGFNLKMFIDSNKLRVIDLLASDDNTNRLDLNELLAHVEQQVNELRASNVEQISIIFDNLQYFLIFNHLNNEDTLIGFCEDLNKLAQKVAQCSIICKFNLADSYEYVCTNLSNLADYTIQVDALKSGKFREVDGKIITKHASNFNSISNKNLFGLDLIEKLFLYKINERNIKIYYPGEFGIKM